MFTSSQQILGVDPLNIVAKTFEYYPLVSSRRKIQYQNINLLQSALSFPKIDKFIINQI